MRSKRVANLSDGALRVTSKRNRIWRKVKHQAKVREVRNGKCY